MTNQVNQAFEEWFESQYNHKPKENNGVYMTMFADGASKGYQASSKAHESEINSLKQRVELLEAQFELDTGLHKLNTKVVLELTTSNNQLREALETTRDYQFDAVNQFHSDFSGYKEDKHKQYDEDLAKTDNALSSTPTQSLAEKEK